MRLSLELEDLGKGKSESSELLSLGRRIWERFSLCKRLRAVMDSRVMDEDDR